LGLTLVLVLVACFGWGAWAEPMRPISCAS